MILLTSATGYLGSNIAREVAARRVPFRVLVRDTARLPWDIEPRNFEIATGDLLDPESVRRSLRGIWSIIHTAALVKLWAADTDLFRRVNSEAFQTLLPLAADAGVERVVYTSTFFALGPSSNAETCEGAKAKVQSATPYAISKRQALEWLRAEGFRQYPVVALIPGVIYGPGPRTEGNLVGGMIRQYLTVRFPGVLGSGEQLWSFAFMPDVVQAHLAALDRGKAGEEFLLGGDNRSLNDFFSLLAKISGVNRPVRHIPIWAATLLGAGELALAKTFRHQPQLTLEAVQAFKENWVYSSSKAARELGYRVTRLEEGLRKTVEAETLPIGI